MYMFHNSNDNNTNDNYYGHIVILSLVLLTILYHIMLRGTDS